MPRIRLFPFFYLLPLILGYFLSTSSAVEHPHKVHKPPGYELVPESEFRVAFQQDSGSDEPPISQAHQKRSVRSVRGVTFLQNSGSDEPPISQAHQKRSVRSVREQPLFATAIPLPKTAYRELQEPVNDAYYDRYGYRDTRLGYRKSLLKEIRDVLDTFDKNYLENGKCEKLKEQASKVVDFLRVALDLFK